MLKEFYVENFKSFLEPTYARIDDLLVLAGSNSGGKSTLIQALLLLSQTLENPRSNVILDLGGKYIQFSEFREAVYGRPKTSDAFFKVGFNLDVAEDDITSEHFYNLGIKSVSPSRQINSMRQGNQVLNNVRVQIEFGADRSGTPLINSAEYQKTVHELGTVKLRLEKYRNQYRTTWEIVPKKTVESIDAKTIVSQLDNLFGNLGDKRSGTRYFPSPRRRLTGIFAQCGFEITDVPEISNSFEHLFENKNITNLSEDVVVDLARILRDICLYTYQKGISSTPSLNPFQFDHFLMPTSPGIYGMDYGSQKILEIFSATFGVTVKEIRNYLRRIQYIGPLRAKPERAYLSTGTPIDIGNAGENAIPILWLNQNEKISSQTKIGEEPTEKRLARAVQDWLQEFNIAYSFHITKPKRVIYQAEVESAPGSKIKVTIADIGFGVSQLLPVIVAGLRATKGSTLVLEQPEIHLHPRLQGKLADFLICLVELGKNVIVETHSEHLINMLRLRIIQDKKGILQERIGIIFVRNWEQFPQDQIDRKDKERKGSYIENLKVDEFGKIINWPVDFFPESSQLNEEILKAMMDKFPG